MSGKVGERVITVEQAQMYRKECKEAIELSTALKRLCNNIDFISVFMDDYVEKEPARLVALLADQSFNMGGSKEQHRAELQERMIGIARFSEYLSNIHRVAEQAKKTLADIAEAEDSYNNSVN